MGSIIGSKTKALCKAFAFCASVNAVDAAQANTPQFSIENNFIIQKSCANALATKIITTTIPLNYTGIAIGQHPQKVKEGNSLRLIVNSALETKNEKYAEILDLLEEKSNKNLLITLKDAPGGDFDIAKSFFDSSRSNSKNHIVTFSQGEIASGATVLAFMGDIRISNKKTTFLIHSAGIYNEDGVKITENTMVEYNGVQKMLSKKQNERLAVVNKILRDMYIDMSGNKMSSQCSEAVVDPLYDTIMTAKQALKFSFTDCIIGEDGTITVREADRNNLQQTCAIQSYRN